MHSHLLSAFPLSAFPPTQCIPTHGGVPLGAWLRLQRPATDALAHNALAHTAAHACADGQDPSADAQDPGADDDPGADEAADYAYAFQRSADRARA